MSNTSKNESNARIAEEARKNAVVEMAQDLGSIYDPYASNREQAEKLIALGWRKQ